MSDSPASLEDRIIDDPLGTYVELHARIAERGSTASFPEFKPIVDFLRAELESEHFQNLLANNPALELECAEVRTFLAHVNLTFSVEDAARYPYLVPFDKPFPYRPTLDAIEAALRLLDKLNRLEPGNRAEQLYHFGRYCYQRHPL